MIVKRGEVYTADLSGSVGHEQAGIRPVVVIQNDVGNQYSETVIVACITSKESKRDFPTHVPIRLAEGQLSYNSIALLEQIRTIDKRRIIHPIGCVDKNTMQILDRVLAFSLALTKTTSILSESEVSNLQT